MRTKYRMKFDIAKTAEVVEQSPEAIIGLLHYIMPPEKFEALRAAFVKSAASARVECSGNVVPFRRAKNGERKS